MIKIQVRNNTIQCFCSHTQKNNDMKKGTQVINLLQPNLNTISP